MKTIAMKDKKTKTIKSEVFHKIYGLTVSNAEPIILDDFKLYNYDLHKMYLGNTYFPENPNVIDGYGFSLDEADKNIAWVSLMVDATDSNEAKNVAYERFEALQGIFRFLVSFLGEDYDIGILNYRRLIHDETIILSPRSRTLSGSAEGARQSIDYKILKALLSERAFSIEDIIGICCKKQKNKMEKRLITSLVFYGKAFFDFGKSISLLESMMAIEALVQRESDQLVSQSISAQIVEYCVFLLGKTYDDRIFIDKQIKYFYHIRSKLAHGESSEVSKQDCNDVIRYARALITIFITNSDINELSNPDDLREYILKLKYR